VTILQIAFNVVVFVLHLILLWWIFHVLGSGSMWSLEKVSVHFFGIALYGSLLIFGTAKITKYFQLSQWRKH
jgi:hypothetical protein